ncbi:MAG: hypothetical protein KBB37_04525 [Bacteroidia bacterium]|nr:hypothetical protein [Bacteroidia bacterium]MBP9179526.1 hypothetical protein [Bacteroidia bacterium]MBP9724004.1 hypothetical protein [Bacteroidia bacterium]
MKNQDIIDIVDINQEFDKIKSRLHLLSDRFLAVAMDYKHYVDSSFKEDRIYALRDNVQYRLFSAKIHLELLLRQHIWIQERLEKGFNNNPKVVTDDYIPINPYFDIYQKEISSILDSFVYHISSVFDYLSTLTNYIGGSNRYDTLMWTQLAKSVRDGKNAYSKRLFASTIDNIDRDFVSKLYDHRAFIIHRNADPSGYSVTLFLGQTERIKVNFLAGKNLVKNFKELKSLSKEKHPTVKYVAFWMLNKSIDKVTDILFALKKEMEFDPKVKTPFMYYLHPETKKALPVSSIYWHEDLYLKENGE